MRKRINAVIDAVMVLVFLPCVYSGIVLNYVLKSGGFRRGYGISGGVIRHLGLLRHQWKDIHVWTGWLFASLVLVHLLLHIRWFRGLPACFRSRR